MKYVCSKCKNDSEFKLRPKGKQIGLYCAKCNKWIKWVGKSEAKFYEYEDNANLPDKLVINGITYIRK